MRVVGGFFSEVQKYCITVSNLLKLSGGCKINEQEPRLGLAEADKYWLRQPGLVVLHVEVGGPACGRGVGVLRYLRSLPT